MPWCDHCEKYWAPSSMNTDGSCPRCGTDLDEPTAAGGAQTAGDEPERASTDDERTPWHFKLMVVALVVYLGWRFVEIGIKIVT